MNFKEYLTFDDVSIAPCFSMIESRKDVDLSCNRDGFPYMGLPVVSSNMDTITGSKMALAMIHSGAQACLHRFQSIEDNLRMLKESYYGATGDYNLPFVSVGLGTKELERTQALFDAGARIFVLDVAHGATMAVVKQTIAIREIIKDNASIVVGNFATADSVKDFLTRTNRMPEGVKLGIGSGSVCSTRVKTGVGLPQITSIMEVSRTLKTFGLTIIADGGMRTPGDIAKAIGAGAHLCMLGGMLAGTEETPAFDDSVKLEMRYIFKTELGFDADKEKVEKLARLKVFSKGLKYRGSASQESYEAQGKEASWRTSEGESTLVPFKGPVKNILRDIEGGLRSSFSYVGAINMGEFQNNVEFVRVTNAGYIEGTPHGKK